ncbi:TetR/AcrR family transcriptional regulator [Frankia sp. Mgl5]|uniref:TetR/AcrR family transcriptional regulator n=1 Tax=Frankia sp. Mgl5 TaxID=2933793 RepID=UPI0034D77E4D
MRRCSATAASVSSTGAPERADHLDQPRQGGRRRRRPPGPGPDPGEPHRAIGAATELFVRLGFAATSTAQIAAAAGVSTPTVFAYFSSKINLLRAAVDEAVAGDDEPVALHEGPAMRAVHDGATAGEVLGAFAVAATEIAQRAFPLLSALRRAADVDPQAGELVRDLEHQRRAVPRRLPRVGDRRRARRADPRRASRRAPATCAILP